MRSSRSSSIDYLRVMRPDHWLKNIFILFGHAVAMELVGIPFSADLVFRVVYSLVPACLIASANYILNEILDAPFDRLHPTKKDRPIPSGKVSVRILWILMGALIVVAFAMSAASFNIRYQISLLLLLLSGLVYNVPPLRLKDRAYQDVIAESFNNPIRLWLGWYAIAPETTFPPMSIVMAWWFFGALLMAGKRYAEFRFINDPKRSGQYRKSFQTYTERSLIISMITYANFFCFCMGIAIAVYRPNLLFVFPVVVIAIIVYFNHAMTTEGARLEPEQLMRNPVLILCTAATIAVSLLLVWTKTDLTEWFNLLKPIGFELQDPPRHR
jgi:decaprenyl-phosphate phosphoribosyltransferase